MRAIETYPGAQRDTTIAWLDDGSYRPHCELCGYDGRTQPSRARAQAAVRQHAGALSHRHRVAQRAVNRRRLGVGP